MEKTKNKISIQTLKWLWLLTALVCLVVFHNYIFGNETVAFYDAGSDTKDQYLMWYSGIINSLKSGTFSAWDFRNGFGYNTMGHPLTDPFLMILYGVGLIQGTEHLAYYLVYMQVAKIFLAGTFCYVYLSEFSLGERAKLLGSLLFAFNGYLIVWGQHFGLGTVVVFLPLLLAFIERTIRKRRFSPGLCLMAALVIFCSFYQGYMCMLGGGIYACVRVLMLEKESKKEKWKALLTTAGCMLLGVALSACRLFASAAAQVGSSGRLESKQSLLERIFSDNLLWPVEIYKTICYRLFSSNIQGNGEDVYLGLRNYYEDVSLFFSALFVILLFQYVVTIHKQDCSRKNKILQYLATLIASVMILMPWATVPFNGFYGEFSRHSFLLMPLFALLCGVMLDRIWKTGKLCLPVLGVSVLIMAAVYWKAYRLIPQLAYRNNALFLAITGISMGIALYLFYRKKIDVNLCFLALTVLTIGNVAADSYMSYSPRVTLTKDHPNYYTETFNPSVQEALAWLEEQDSGFYRVEKDYFTASSCLDSLVQDYRGMSSYNSNQNEGIKRFVRILWPMLYNENDRNHMQFQNGLWDNTMGALSGVKYVLSKSDSMEVAGYERIHQAGDIYIYRNTACDSIGKFFDKTITEKKYKKQKDKLDTRAFLTDVLIVEEKDDFTIKDSERKGYEKEIISDILSENESQTYHYTLNSEELVAYTSITMEFTLAVEERTEVKVKFDGEGEHSFVANRVSDQFQITVPGGTGKVSLEIMTPQSSAVPTEVEFYGYRQEQNFSEDASITIDRPQKDSYFTGHISAGKAGMVMLAIPMEKGWSIYLNGEKQEVVTGDYGFTAFAVEAGEYELEAKFEAPMLKAGCWVSAASVLIFLGLTIMASRKDRPRKVQRKEG